MTKQEKIAAYLKEPLKVGDVINNRYINTKDSKCCDMETVVKIDDEYAYFKQENYRELSKIKLSEIEKCDFYIGVDTFTPDKYHQKYAIDIEQLIWRCGYERDGKSRMERYFGTDIPEVCFNPMVIDNDGNEVEFQRGLVWTIEQKQLLIESIYNNIEIGKVVFRKRDFHWVENRIKAGKLEHTAFMDLIDGKQRFITIFEFINNKFPDLHGNYFDDFSNNAKVRFRNYNNLTYVELNEDTKDKDVIEQFLAINFAGVPMSKEHIDFVKSIKVK
jgi:hypothetical protein